MSRAVRASLISESVITDSNLNPDIQKHYQFVKVIGHGHFGTVREATRNSASSQLVSSYAVKSVPKSKITKELVFLRRELEILMSVDHPNIVKFYEVYEDESFLHLVMELCRGGDLLEHLCNSSVYTEATAARVLSKLMAGVNHLHHQHFAHRDLKPENFLYTTEGPDTEVKLVDFGLAVKYEPGVPMKSLVGTPYFVAPEVLRGRYSHSCDVWSLGVIFYMMLCGEPPFTGRNVTEVYQKATSGKIDFDKEE
jgi:calcium-dependent protein kinase